MLLTFIAAAHPSLTHLLFALCFIERDESVFPFYCPAWQTLFPRRYILQTAPAARLIRWSMCPDAGTEDGTVIDCKCLMLGGGFSEDDLGAGRGFYRRSSCWREADFSWCTRSGCFWRGSDRIRNKKSMTFWKSRPKQIQKDKWLTPDMTSLAKQILPLWLRTW